ncbi:phage protease [Ruegeria sp.]|uniref:phage protease n=1 Tax=Ruegeria sp. TaxID=1879320 RepID=UPI003B5CD88D
MDGHTDIRAVCAMQLPEGAEPPSEILLIPAGEVSFRPHDGRDPVHNSNPAAVVAATMALRGETGVDLVIDFEHQTEFARSNGQPAPAAGWISRVFERGGAVWGAVRWTERAAAMIAAREYRYISPVFFYHAQTHEVTLIVSAALTNDPALHMRALARAETHSEKEGREMDLEKLRKALGLAADADEAAIVAAAGAAHSAAGVLGETRKALELDEAADSAAILAAARAGGSGDDDDGGDGADADPDPAQFVPRAEFDRVSASLTSLQTERVEERATAAVDAATEAGKIAPAQRDWALAYAKKDPSGFEKFAASAAAILPKGQLVPDQAPAREAGSLTVEEKAVCRATGVSEKAFIESANARKEAVAHE